MSVSDTEGLRYGRKIPCPTFRLRRNVIVNPLVVETALALKQLRYGHSLFERFIELC